jgi:cysteine sulfinate desulfinase/cysteine desulfurase-like protein
MGVPRSLALGSIRLSLGHETTPDDVGRAAAVFPQVVEKVRKLAVVLGRV